MGEGDNTNINTLLGDIVGVDQSHKVGRKSDSEADEGSQLPVVSLANKDVEFLPQLLSPVHTESHEVLLWSLRPSIWCQLVGVEILQSSEGGHEGVGVSPSHRDPVQFPSQHVGRPIEAAWNNKK